MAPSISTALRTIRKMEEYGLAFVEEPIPAWDWRGRIKVAQAISIPIMRDESVFTPQDIARQIDLGAIGIISIKAPGTGYTLSQKIIPLAETADIPCLMWNPGRDEGWHSGQRPILRRAPQRLLSERDIFFPKKLTFLRIFIKMQTLFDRAARK